MKALPVKLMTVAATSFLLSITGASAADRVLDFAEGCKLYQLQNRAWVETDSSVLQNFQLPQAQIVKDEKFTVFRAGGLTYGVNQKCVREAAASTAEQAPPPAAPQRRGSKRASAARAAAEPSPFNSRGKWAAAFLLGMNLSPSGTIEYTGSLAAPATAVKLKNSVNFEGEADYRYSEHVRFAAGLGISQLSQDTATGNETSFFYVRPDFPFRVSPKMEVYVGPILGLFFLSQNATHVTDPVDITTKEQTASAFLLGAALGADYAIGDQFDLGLSLQYFKPGSLKIEGFEFSTDPFTSTLSVKYMSIGARFAIHF